MNKELKIKYIKQIKTGNNVYSNCSLDICSNDVLIADHTNNLKVISKQLNLKKIYNLKSHINNCIYT